MVFKNLYLTSHEFPCRAERKSQRTDTKTQRSHGHFETFAKNASYMGGLREGWIEKHSNEEEATGRREEPRQRMQ